MANLNTPRSAAKTKEDLESPETREGSRNPTVVIGGDERCGGVVHVSLRFVGGLTVSPLEIYEALDAKFETVSAIQPPARNSFVYQIEPTAFTESEQGETPASVV